MRTPMSPFRFWRRHKVVKRSAAGKLRTHTFPLRLLALEGRVVPAALTIAQENLLPGAPQSQWDVSGAGDATLQGFATDISVNQGQTVSFKINDTAGAPYHIDIYRMGYYQGNGARKVATIASSQTQARVQPSPVTEAA